MGSMREDTLWAFLFLSEKWKKNKPWRIEGKEEPNTRTRIRISSSDWKKIESRWLWNWSASGLWFRWSSQIRLIDKNNFYKSYFLVAKVNHIKFMLLKILRYLHHLKLHSKRLRYFKNGKLIFSETCYVV